MEAEKDLGEVQFAGGDVLLGGKVKNPKDWLIRGSPIIPTCARRSMSFASVYLVRRPFWSWVTHLMDP